MKEYKTINEVIKKGQLMINIPVKIIMIVVPIILPIGLLIVFPKEQIIFAVLIGIFIGIFLGFALAWIWWSFRIPNWRIWAFENTKRADWVVLKQRAINEKLIWEDGNKFGDTEIRSNKQQNKIKEIESEIKNLTKEDPLENIEDDPSIPEKINYYFKKSEIILSLILPFFLLAIGIYLIRVLEFIPGVLALGLVIYYTHINKIKNVFKREIQFSISNEGITIYNLEQLGFIKWEDTKNIKIDPNNGILSLEIYKKDEVSEVNYKLNEYQIESYFDFTRKINVYLKRNSENNNSEQSAKRL